MGNALRHGVVRRTMWPPAPGTQQWLTRFGEALLCVRHRDDPAGVRRVITVELVVDVVGSRPRQPGLRDSAWYPMAIRHGPADRRLRGIVKAHGGHWDLALQTWYLPGKVIRELKLEDHVLVPRGRQFPKLRGVPAEGEDP